MNRKFLFTIGGSVQAISEINRALHEAGYNYRFDANNIETDAVKMFNQLVVEHPHEAVVLYKATWQSVPQPAVTQEITP
jgi:hypothetical protein